MGTAGDLRCAAEERLTRRKQRAFDNPAMSTVAVIEDDIPTSNQLRGWIEAARPGIVVHQWFNRDDAACLFEPRDATLELVDAREQRALTLGRRYERPAIRRRTR